MITKKKIHFVHFTSQPGGIELKRILLIENMKEFDFCAFVMRPHRSNNYNVYNNVPIKVSYGAKGFIAYLYLLKYAINKRKDIFHVFNIGPVALLILRIAGVKNLIYAIHGTIYWKTRYQQICRKVIWKNAMNPNYIITANSIYSRDVFIKDVLKESTPLVLYNPINVAQFKWIAAKQIEERREKIVYSGRLAPGKNLYTWIKIANEIHTVYPQFYFEIYGAGPLKQSLVDFINKNNYNEFIQVKGFCSKPEEIYQNANLMLFLSEYESFGNVVIESILCETPVLVSALPSLMEVFQNFPEFLIQMDDKIIEQVLIKLEKLETMKEYAVKAANEFKDRFSLNQHISKVEKFYASFHS